MGKKTISSRRKLLSLLPRRALEEIAEMSRPWLADTNNLKQNIMTLWDNHKDEVEYEVNKAIKDLFFFANT